MFAAMKQMLVGCFLLMAIQACNNEANFTKAEDAQDAGREFIRASLDGNIPKAEFYLLKDTASLMVFNNWKAKYQHLSAEEKVYYEQANILPSKIENVNDSTVNFTYTNTYKKNPTTLKIVRINGEWLIDLKELH